MGIRTMWSPPSPALKSTVTDELVTLLVRARRGLGSNAGYAFDEGAEALVLAGGMQAEARTLSFLDDSRLYVVFAPACGGRMTYVFATISTARPGADDVAKSWLKSIDGRGIEASPACQAARRMARVQ